MSIKLKIKRVYRSVPYVIEADFDNLETVDTVVSLVRKAEQFIDKAWERKT